jgi:hypothetical protein
MTTRADRALRTITRLGFLNEFSTISDTWFVAHRVPGGVPVKSSVLIDNRVAFRLIDRGCVERLGAAYCSGTAAVPATVLRAAHAYEKATGWRQRRPVLDPGAAFSTALPPPPPPKSAGDPGTRDMVMAACRRAGLSLNDDQIAMICAASPYVTAMTGRLRRERDFREEPANIFQFPRGERQER